MVDMQLNQLFRFLFVLKKTIFQRFFFHLLYMCSKKNVTKINQHTKLTPPAKTKTNYKQKNNQIFLINNFVFLSFFFPFFPFCYSFFLCILQPRLMTVIHHRHRYSINVTINRSNEMISCYGMIIKTYSKSLMIDMFRQ